MASLIEDNAVQWKIRQGGLPEYQRVITLVSVLTEARIPFIPETFFETPSMIPLFRKYLL